MKPTVALAALPSLVLLAPISASAQAVAPTPAQQSATPPAGAAQTRAAAPQEPVSMFDPARTNLLGDLFGLRPEAAAAGVTIGLVEASELFGNLTGGIRQGASYNGLATLSLALDTQKAFGWAGGTLNVSALQIHGRNFTTDNAADLQTPSGIEADRSTRLWELWFQQSLPSGSADIRVGQQSLDQEFLVSTYASTFINTAAGWPALPSYDLYAGGPAYPVSSLGVRVRALPLPAVTVLAGVFDDNPPGGPFTSDSALRGAEQSGAAFNLNTGALVIGELQYAVGQPVDGKSAAGGPLPATYKLGAWFDTAQFPAQDQPTNAAGDPRRLRHDFSIYAVVDQMLWRASSQSVRALGVAVRVMGAPDDRNLINFAANVGFVLKAPFAGHDNDNLGLLYGLAKVKGASTNAGSENFVEATYQYQVAPWWVLQPDVQYVFTPAAGIADPLDPSRRIGNELIVGLRATLTL